MSIYGTWQNHVCYTLEASGKGWKTHALRTNHLSFFQNTILISNILNLSTIMSLPFHSLPSICHLQPINRTHEHFCFHQIEEKQIFYNFFLKFQIIIISYTHIFKYNENEATTTQHVAYTNSLAYSCW